MDRLMPLPIELVLNVITCCLPASGVLLNQFHDTTKTLLLFTQVCRETRRVANRYLRDHCVYLDSPDRLRWFLLDIKRRPELGKVPALFLAPFNDTIDDLPTCSGVRELFNCTCETLKKLVIDIPLRTCYPEDDVLRVRPVLREGFERLVNLEECVSVRDELYLDVAEFEYSVIWTKWPRLKRLSVFNADADEVFWRHVAQHPSLNMLVLVYPDTLSEVDPRAVYFRHTSRPLTLIAGFPSNYRLSQPSAFKHWDWDNSDPERRMTIIAHPLGHRSICHFQVKRAAERGTLWEWYGERVTRPEQMSLLC